MGNSQVKRVLGKGRRRMLDPVSCGWLNGQTETGQEVMDTCDRGMVEPEKLGMITEFME